MNYNDYNDYNNQNDSFGDDTKEKINFSEWGDDPYTYPGDGAPVLIDEAKEKKNFSRLGFGYALFSVISLAASLIIQLAVLRLAPDFYQTTLFMNILSPISLYIFALPVLLIIISSSEAKAPPKRRMGFGAFLVFLIVSFGCMYIGSYIGNFTMSVISSVMNYDYSNALNSIIDYDNLWITAIFTVIVAPIAEELVFRKLIIDRTQKYGGFVCVLLSALIFGLMHGNLYQFFYCFFLGLILGYIYYSTGKIHLTIVIHAIINFFGSIFSAWLSPIAEKMLELTESSDTEAYIEFLSEHGLELLLMSGFSIFIYASMLAAIILPIVLRKKIVLARGEITIPKNRIFKVVFLNAGILVMLIVYALEFALNLLPL